MFSGRWPRERGSQAEVLAPNLYNEMVWDLFNSGLFIDCFLTNGTLHHYKEQLLANPVIKCFSTLFFCYLKFLQPLSLSMLSISL